MNLPTDILKPGSTSLRVEEWLIRLGFQAPAPPPMPTEDDPTALARLAAIMSDRVERCPTCGRDPHICRAMECDTDMVSTGGLVPVTR